MKVKCSYCGNYISDTEEKCPNCMAPNDQLKRVGNAVPQTIEDLKNWYVEHNLPPEETTRFFIGKDIREPRAFGVYYDDHSGNYIVYKNKDSGQRAVRYEGKDEAYAVNELYLKLKEEILHQKDLNRTNHMSSFIRSYRTAKKSTSKFLLIFFCVNAVIFLTQFAAVVGMFIFTMFFYKAEGYYEYQEQPYYLYDGCMTFYDSACEWYRYDTNSNQWSVSERIKSKKAEYVGTEWNHHLGIDLQQVVEDADCYREKHPPTPSTGYYKYNGQIYYYYNGWYVYNNDSWSQWSQSSVPSDDVKLHPEDYYDTSSTSDDTYGFKDSSYYGYSSSSYDNDSSWSSSSNDDWDSGSSWDSNDSWDSGSTDWDSDW